MFCWVKTCFFVGTCGDFCLSRSLLISLKKAWRRLFWGGGEAWSLALWCRKWSQPCRRRDFWFFHMPRFFRRRNLFLGGWGVGLKWSFFFFGGGGCQVFVWVTGDVGFVLPKKCVSNFWKGVWQQLFWSPFGGLQMMKSVHLFACDVYWVCPPPSNSHHQDYFIFSRGSQPKPLFATGILRPHPWHKEQTMFFFVETVWTSQVLFLARNSEKCSNCRVVGRVGGDAETLTKLILNKWCSGEL